MEIPLCGTKEKKKRFFRKTGSGGSSSSSSRGGGSQNSWDSLQHSPVSSMTNSFENATTTTGPTTVAPTSNNPLPPPAQPLNNLNYPGSATPPRKNQQRTKLQGVTTGSPGNSISLDEAEHILQQHRRFMGAPRRARSAERFDGMRINNSSGEKQVHYPTPTREQLLDKSSPSNSNKFNPTRPAARPTSGGASPAGTTAPTGDLRRTTQLPLGGPSVVSPPPPYQAAVNEKSGPPTYRQALALAAQTQSVKGQMTTARPMTLNRTRHHHRGGQSQSFDFEFGSSGTTMRSAVSVPAFSNEAICNCSKCQIQNKAMLAGEDAYGNGGDYNDSAVYMESQAFLMHEIMTDGMAFCSIM